MRKADIQTEAKRWRSAAGWPCDPQQGTKNEQWRKIVFSAKCGEIWILSIKNEI